jgi:hypothetical protein
MTPKRARELLPILEHIAKGGRGDDIEENFRGRGWRVFNGSFVGNDNYSYRFKPEPLEMWVNAYSGPGNNYCPHNSPEEAAERLLKGGWTIHMREVR